MRIVVLLASIVASVAVPVAIIACSSSSGSASNGVDAQGPQTVGAPCDPASSDPCLPSGDRCVGVTCDPVLRTCMQFATDAGAPCNANLAPCTSTADCDLGLTCGFPVAGGCAAQGTCINPPLPCENDAASCGSELPVCGCDGRPDPFVVPGYAVAPVASTIACPDGGAVIDAEATDAPSSDASDGADADAG